jgi:hypothetical protein
LFSVFATASAWFYKYWTVSWEYTSDKIIAIIWSETWKRDLKTWYTSYDWPTVNWRMNNDWTSSYKTPSIDLEKSKDTILYKTETISYEKKWDDIIYTTPTTTLIIWKDKIKYTTPNETKEIDGWDWKITTPTEE